MGKNQQIETPVTMRCQTRQEQANKQTNKLTENRQFLAGSQNLCQTLKFTSTGDPLNSHNGGNKKPILYLDPLLSVLSVMQDIEDTWFGGDPVKVKFNKWERYSGILVQPVILKVPDNLSHFSRHGLAYFEARSSIFVYMSHVSMKLRVLQRFCKNSDSFLSIAQN